MAGKSTSLSAVCFDYRGTLLDHRSDRSLIDGMEDILSSLRKKKVPMALISRFPAEALKERLGGLEKYFGDNVFSGGGKGKLECIRKFAQRLGVEDLSRIAFVDDKPDNFVPAAEDSEIYVIGFAGSGKYPDVESVCKEKKIAFAESVPDLKKKLLGRV